MTSTSKSNPTITNDASCDTTLWNVPNNAVQDEYHIDNSEESRGLSQFGFFDESGQERQNADKVCVLVVHYKFEGHGERIERDGNQCDLNKLRETFYERRKCRYKELGSRTRSELIDIFRDETKLMQQFDSPGSPSVFLLFILSHGLEDGKIQTEKRDITEPGGYECFTTFEVIDYLKQMPMLKDSLKIIYFAACRGKYIDTYADAGASSQESEGSTGSGEVFQNSCRLTSFPAENNFILVYPSVESTVANREPSRGTWLVQETCTAMELLQDDVPVEVLLAIVQKRVHLHAQNFLREKDRNAQTVEVKFTPHQKFMIYRSVAPSSPTDGPRKYFFPWQTKNDVQIRGRIAGIFYESKTEDVRKIFSLLKEQLDFKTSMKRNTSGNLELFRTFASDSQCPFGCLLLCFFGKILEHDGEICIIMDKEPVKVGDLVRMFVGPENSMWVSRPKIFFFVDQTSSVDTEYPSKKFDLRIRGTNHSGWFIHVMPNKGSERKLAEMLCNPNLRNGTRSFQELAMQILRQENSEATPVFPLISSTLHHLLDFPDWSKSFVPPKLKVTKVGISSFGETFSFEEVETDFINELNTKDEYCIRVVTAQSGYGKSTLLSELSHNLRMSQERLVVKIPFYSENDFFVDHRHGTQSLFKDFIESDDFRKKYITEDLWKENGVIFLLDGFDQVHSFNKESALNLLEQIAKLRLPLWVTTRPQDKQSIVDKLMAFPVKTVEILPFHREQQFGVLQIKAANLSEEECREKMNNLEQMGAGELLLNPLHLTLLVDSEKLNLYELYDDVIRKKVNVCIQTTTELAMTDIKLRVQLLQKYALCSVQESDWEDQAPLSEDDRDKINITGIATVLEGGMPKFAHQSFATFLISKKFLDELRKHDGSSDVKIFEPVFEECRQFVDSFLSTNSASDVAPKFSAYVQRENCLEIILQLILDEELVNTFKTIKNLCTVSRNIGEKNHISIEYLLEAAEYCPELAIELLQMIDFELDFLIYSELLSIAYINDHMHLLTILMRKMPTKVSNEYLATGLDDTVLFAAAKTGDNEKLIDFIISGFDMKQTNARGETALHCACKGGSYDCAELLIQKLVSANIHDQEGITALHRAAENLDHRLVELLLSKNCDVRALDKEGWNSLHYAAHSGALRSVELLLDKCIDLSKETTVDGLTSLQLSIFNNDFNVCKLLVEKSISDSNSVVPNCSLNALQALKEAIKRQKFNVAEKLLTIPGFNLNLKDESGKTALHSAAEEGSISGIKWLLKQKADLDEVTDYGATALMLAAGATTASSVPVCRLLVDNGADILAVDADGNTCLHWACVANQARTVEYLTSEVFKDIDKKNHAGKTALHLATEKGSFALVVSMLKPKIVAKHNVNNSTAFQNAVRDNSAKIMVLLKPNLRKLLEDETLRTLAAKNPDYEVRRLFRVHDQISSALEDAAPEEVAPKRPRYD